MRNGTIYKIAALTVTVTSLCGGCRSMSKWNPLARRSEPSAEMLAGAGPTTTYPKPPSSGATPQAIASVAGGTASPGSAPSYAKAPGAGIGAGAGIGTGAAPGTGFGAAAGQGLTAQASNLSVSPGYAVPAGGYSPPKPGAGNVNYSAATANGIVNQPVGFKTPSAPTTTNQAPPSTFSPGASATSGYQFGNQAKTATSAPANATASISDMTKSATATKAGTPAVSAPPAGWTPPPFGAEKKPAFTASMPSSAPAKPATTGSVGAFAIPPMNSPSTAQAFITPPAATAPNPGTSSSPSTASAFAMPGLNTKPVSDSINSVKSGVMASVADASGKLESSVKAIPSLGTSASGSTSAAGSYLPGSTGAASTGYPGAKPSNPGTNAPNTSGSFYR